MFNFFLTVCAAMRHLEETSETVSTTEIATEIASTTPLPEFFPENMTATHLARRGEITTDHHDYTIQLNSAVFKSVSPPIVLHKMTHVDGWSRIEPDLNGILPEDKKHIFKCGAVGMTLIELNITYNDCTKEAYRLKPGDISVLWVPILQVAIPNVDSFMAYFDQLPCFNFTGEFSAVDEVDLQNIIRTEHIGTDCTYDGSPAVFNFEYFYSAKEKGWVSYDGHMITKLASGIESEEDSTGRWLVVSLVACILLCVLALVAFVFVKSRKKTMKSTEITAFDDEEAINRRVRGQRIALE